MQAFNKTIIIIFLVLTKQFGQAQCETHGCDPQLTGFGFDTECITQNGNSTINLGWFLGGGDPTCTTPPNSWRIQISLPLSAIYGANSIADINGPGFDWVYSAGNKTFTGTNNVQMAWLAGGNISINVTGLVINSCNPISSQVNIGIIPLFQSGCPQAFNNQIANDALSSGKGVQSPLPVALSSFSAKNSNCSEVIIEWSTSSELNSDFIELERSENAYDWQVIYRVKSFNHISGAAYHFQDKLLVGGKIYFYRLRQVDFDGKEALHKTISLTTNQCLTGKLDFGVYPNPAMDKINILLKGFNQEDRIMAVITNAIGEKVKVLSLLQMGATISVSLNELNPGIYYIKLIGFENIETKRFIKIN
jgi:hypothetical protein